MTRNKILFVDDDVNVLNALQRSLDGESFTCFFAKSSQAALNIMQTHDITVIVADMKMPIMSGLELLEIVKEKYPLTVRVVLSGYTQLSQVLVTVNKAQVFKFIAKPLLGATELKKIIEECLAFYYHQLQKKENLDKAEKKVAVYEGLLQNMEQKILVKNAELKSHQNLLMQALPFFIEEKLIFSQGLLREILSFCKEFNNNDLFAIQQFNGHTFEKKISEKIKLREKGLILKPYTETSQIFHVNTGLLLYLKYRFFINFIKKFSVTGIQLRCIERNNTLILNLSFFNQRQITTDESFLCLEQMMLFINCLFKPLGNQAILKQESTVTNLLFCLENIKI